MRRLKLFRVNHKTVVERDQRRWQKHLVFFLFFLVFFFSLLHSGWNSTDIQPTYCMAMSIETFPMPCIPWKKLKDIPGVPNTSAHRMPYCWSCSFHSSCIQDARLQSIELIQNRAYWSQWLPYFLLSLNSMKRILRRVFVHCSRLLFSFEIILLHCKKVFFGKHSLSA